MVRIEIFSKDSEVMSLFQNDFAHKRGINKLGQ